MCELFENHLTSLGYRSPGTLVAKMFKYMHERYCHAADPPAEAQNSNARVASPAHDNADDGGVDAVPAEDEAPLPSPADGIVPEDVLDLRMATVRGKTTVKEVDATAGIDGIVEDVQPKEEASVTEKMESDGLYNASGTEYCAASQPTEILPSTNSSAHGR